jgi:hypothetical protein
MICSEYFQMLTLFIQISSHIIDSLSFVVHRLSVFKHCLFILINKCKVELFQSIVKLEIIFLFFQENLVF